MDWRENIITDIDQVRGVLRDAKRVAVLGIKPEDHADRAAFYVPEYLQSVGYEIVPVPVYYPEVTEILSRKVYRKLADIPGDIDVVDVFRRPNDIPPHVPDILAKKPRWVWNWLPNARNMLTSTPPFIRCRLPAIPIRC